MSNRVILVTGGNKGIGKAICKKIVETHSDCIVLLGSRDEERGSSACADIISSVPSASSRITPIKLDVTSPSSITSAADLVSNLHPSGLYGIVNNAGIGFGRTIKDTVTCNTIGPKLVNDAFIPLLRKDGEKRIVNIASASGPNFVKTLTPDDQQWYQNPAVTWDEIQSKIQSVWEQPDYDNTAYGFSKALLNLYTLHLANAHPTISINSCTPGWIATDLTAGMGASNPPEKGTLAPMHCLFGDLKGAQGWYFGSDAVRSPLDVYRGPGDPPYEP